METTKRELSMEQLEDVAGGMMPSCFHPKVSEYLGQKKERLGETLYLWKCASCGNSVWCLNVPKTGGATSSW